MPKLSIITVNLNNKTGLIKTAESVVSQTWTDYEWIIIDGGSTDGSVEVIKEYAHNIRNWISEPDTGVYNAMNKGIRKAQGEYCLFLNSGDWLISPDTLDNVFKEISRNTSDIYYSDMNKSDNTIYKLPEHLTSYSLIHDRINHQNSLIKRSLFLEHGLYNENLTICSDYEYFLNEFWKYKSTFTKIETNISIYDVHGISSENFNMRHAEDLIVYKNVFQEFADIIFMYLESCDEVYKIREEFKKRDVYSISLKKLYKIVIKRSIKKILQIIIPARAGKRKE